METNKFQMVNEAIFSEIKPSSINKSFEEAIVRIACTGDNANGSHFTLDSFNKALPSLKNIPIVALYKEDEDDFGGHESSYVIKDGEFKIVYNTFPFGVIPESAKQWYEEVEENGQVKTYLVSECLLWKRQKSYDLIKENGSYSVSMEIEVISGSLNGSSIYEIDDFIFTAVCVLGKDVTPCFKSAEIKLFSENVEYNDMLNAYKQFAIDVFKGGENVNDEVLNVVESEMTETSVADETATNVVEEATNEVEDVVESVNDEVVEDEATESDVKDEEEVEESTEESQDSTQVESQEVVNEVVVDFEAKYNELQIEFGKVVNELNEMKVEFERLQQFEQSVLLEKRNTQEAELFAKFTMLNGVVEFEQLKGDCAQFSLEQIENMCYAMVGRQSFSLKQKPKAPTQTSVKLNFSSNQDSKPIAYGGILG